MPTFVLVHGAWSGAHGFRKVRPLLRDRGHEVFTPSLTGIGERAHLTSPLVNLTTHIRDVVNTVLYEDLTDIVLVGFSYGGFVVTGALDHVGDRVRHLVYLDAFVPASGDNVMGLAGRNAAEMITLGADWLVPPPPRAFDDPVEAAWQNQRRTAHPVGCFTEAVRLTQPLERFPFTRTYIKATADSADAPGSQAFWSAAEMARASPDWRYREVATTHMVASNRPAELVQLLLELTQLTRVHPWRRCLPLGAIAQPDVHHAERKPRKSFRGESARNQLGARCRSDRTPAADLAEAGVDLVSISCVLRSRYWRGGALLVGSSALDKHWAMGLESFDARSRWGDR